MGDFAAVFFAQLHDLRVKFVEVPGKRFAQRLEFSLNETSDVFIL